MKKKYRRVLDINSILDGLGFAQDTSEIITIWFIWKGQRIIFQTHSLEMQPDSNTLLIGFQFDLIKTINAHYNTNFTLQDFIKLDSIYLHCLSYFMVFKTKVLDARPYNLFLQIPSEIQVIELRDESRVAVKKSPNNIVTLKILHSQNQKRRINCELHDISLRGIGIIGQYNQVISFKVNNELMIEQIGLFEFIPAIKGKIVYIWQGEAKHLSGHMKKVSKIGIAFEKTLPQDIGLYVEF